MNKGFTIIIAEDDADDQLFITDALLRNHFDGAVSCVGDGNMLMQLLKRDDSKPRPALILLDLNMPFKNGYEVLAEIKGDPSLQAIPVAVLTSSSSSEDERRCYALGAERFYRKPLSLHDYDRVAGSILDFIRPV